MPNFARILYFLWSGLRRLHWDKERIRRLQDKRLRAVVRYAYEFVPFYRERFRQVGISPWDIKTVGDLEKLPVIGKDELRTVDVSRLISKEYDVSSLKVLRTSGSTGKPFKFFVSNAEDDWRKAIYLRANFSCGQRPWDRWVFVTSPRHFGDTTGIQRKLGVFAQTVIPVFESVDNQVRHIRKAKPDVLDGYSGALSLIAREFERQSIMDVRPRLMFGSADSIDASSRRLLEKVFNAPYLDQYGCSEVDRTAWQCPLRGGYHMDVDSVVTQFVDENGMDVGVGESGEIVLTSLFNFAMPFIRYSLGDAGRASDSSCSCGRVLPLMESVEGRRDSFVVLPDGRMVSPRVLTVAMSMFEFYDGIEQFRIVQRQKDLFEVFLKVKASLLNRKEEVASRVAGHLEQALSVGGLDVVFNVQFADEIPLSSSGKLMAVVSEVRM